jgi:hypothetical protein
MRVTENTIARMANEGFVIGGAADGSSLLLLDEDKAGYEDPWVYGRLVIMPVTDGYLAVPDHPIVISEDFGEEREFSGRYALGDAIDYLLDEVVRLGGK